MGIRTVCVIAAALALGFTSLTATAAEELRVKCEKRGVTRSKASVDGKGLAAGSYFAVLEALNAQQAVAATAQSTPANTAGDEVEFDFDSNANDIAEGATGIAANFISGTQVRGRLFRVVNGTSTEVLSRVADCRVRNR
jgi:hypothetical protein